MVQGRGSQVAGQAEELAANGCIRLSYETTEWKRTDGNTEERVILKTEVEDVSREKQRLMQPREFRTNYFQRMIIWGSETRTRQRDQIREKV